MQKDNSLHILNPMRYYWVYFLISLSVILPGVYSLIKYGLKPSIDFTGGTNIIWQDDTLKKEDIENKAKDLGIPLLNLAQEGTTFSLSTPPLTTEKYQEFKSASSVELSFDSVGPILGEELIRKTIYGILLAGFAILFYIATRFKNFKFGASAILAMLHDSMVILGTFSLLGHYQGVEVDTLFVTALLTILSFSVHDTIVVYDRIRELKKKYLSLDFSDVVNRAVVETMGRSLNNSLTIIFMLLSMYLLGGESTKWFIFALLIGTISGTYSSTFTAAPLLIFWEKLFKKRLG